MSAIEEEIQEILAQARARREQYEQPEVDLEKLGVGAAEGAAIGAAALPALGEAARRLPRGRRAPAALAAQVGARLRGRPARMGERVTESLAEAAAEYPTMTAGIEVAGGAGAGAALEYARQMEASPEGQMTAALVGGLAAGAAPVALPNLLARAARWGMENLVTNLSHLPGVNRLPGMQSIQERSAMDRAGRRLQGLAEDPEEAARLAVAGPEGVSPARRTGQEPLMGLERRIFQDDPPLRREVREDLAEASRRAQEDLAELYGTPAGRQDWEQTVIQRVAPPGSDIQAGYVDEMLDQAYRGFGALYAPIRELPLRLQIVAPGRRTTLKTMLDNVPETNTVVADDAARNTVRRWLNNELTAVQRTVDKKGLVTAGAVLDLRQAIRDRARIEAANPEKRDIADLFRHADKQVSRVLHSQLSGDARGTLRAADEAFDQYQIVEDAVYRSINRELNPSNLLRSIRGATPEEGAAARGESYQELFNLGQIGRSIAEAFKSPQVAQGMARAADAGQRKELHAAYMKELARRATTTAEDGTDLISGARLLDGLRRTTDTARSLGIDARQIARMRRIGQELQTIQRKSPEEISQLLVDGPSNVMQLLATLLSVKGGARLGRGTGASQMVLSGFIARRARGMLDFLTKDRAAEILVQAHTDPKLYSALMTRETDSVAKQIQAIRTLQAWLGMPMAEAMRSADVDELRELGSELLGD